MTTPICNLIFFHNCSLSHSLSSNFTIHLLSWLNHWPSLSCLMGMRTTMGLLFIFPLTMWTISSIHQTVSLPPLFPPSITIRSSGFIFLRCSLSLVDDYDIWPWSTIVHYLISVSWPDIDLIINLTHETISNNRYPPTYFSLCPQHWPFTVLYLPSEIVS